MLSVGAHTLWLVTLVAASTARAAETAPAWTGACAAILVDASVSRERDEYGPTPRWSVSWSRDHVSILVHDERRVAPRRWSAADQAAAAPETPWLRALVSEHGELDGWRRRAGGREALITWDHHDDAATAHPTELALLESKLDRCLSPGAPRDEPKGPLAVRVARCAAALVAAGAPPLHVRSDFEDVGAKRLVADLIYTDADGAPEVAVTLFRGPRWRVAPSGWIESVTGGDVVIASRRTARGEATLYPSKAPGALGPLRRAIDRCLR